MGERSLTEFTRRSLITLCTTLSVLSALPARAEAPAATLDPTSEFLARLRAASLTPLTHDDFVQCAASLQVEAEALEAVATAENNGGTGYDESGRPLILFEPHIFARRTNNRFNETHPAISYPSFDARRYPRSQDERWAQLAEAYALSPQEALAATSWGAFQLMGYQYQSAGYATVEAFILDLAHSPQHQLAAWARWIQSNGLVDEIQRKDWAGFARGYNGPGYAAGGYDRRIAERYAQLTAPN